MDFDRLYDKNKDIFQNMDYIIKNIQKDIIKFLDKLEEKESVNFNKTLIFVFWKLIRDALIIKYINEIDKYDNTEEFFEYINELCRLLILELKVEIKHFNFSKYKKK